MNPHEVTRHSDGYVLVRFIELLDQNDKQVVVAFIPHDPEIDDAEAIRYASEIIRGGR